MLNAPSPALLEALKAAVGPSGWRDPAPDDPWLEEPRAKWRGRAAILLRPETPEAVARAVRLCAAARAPVVARGGGTGLVGGQIKPEGPAPVVIGLERLNRVRAISAAENVLTIEAGATLAAAQAAAESADRLFPLTLASQGSCTVGGVLATNAGGVQVLRYGNARDLCLGLEAVTAQGEIWSGISPLRKNNTGFDLRHLLIGSEGTLAIITAASLRLFPRPRGRATAFIALTSARAALAVLGRLQEESGGLVSAFELMPRFGLELSMRATGERSPLASPSVWMALAELSGPAEEPLAAAMERALGAAMEAEELSDAAFAASDSARASFWRLREALSDAQKLEGGGIKHDVSLPLERIGDFLEQGAALIERLAPGARPCPFGHVGDGNLHYNILPPAGASAAPFLARWSEISRAVHDLTSSMGGSISAEHGIGRLKTEDLARAAGPVKMGMLRAVKTALDPLGILNPGVIFPEE